MTFAIITPALITGATADRLKFSAYAVFIAIWLVLVYAPGRALGVRRRLARRHGRARLRRWRGRAHQRRRRGARARARDRQAQGLPGHAMPPHNLPMTMIGTGILWFGWAGFNAGSALAANGVAAVGDHEHVPRRLGRHARLAPGREDPRGARPTTLGAVSGAVAGLVAITPCAGLRRRHGADLHRRHRRRRLLPGARHSRSWASSTTASTSSPCTSSVGSSGRSCSGSSPTRAINGVVINEGVFLGGGTELLKDQIVASVVTLVVLVRGHDDHRPRSST